MSFVIKATTFVVLGACVATPLAPVFSDPLLQQEARTGRVPDWSNADLVCEIDGDVWAVDIDTGEPEKVLLIKDARKPSVRPGTRDIAFVRGADIWLWSASDGSESKLADGVLLSEHKDVEPAAFAKLAWHPDGRWLAFSTPRPLTWQAEGRLPRACSYYDFLDSEWARVCWFHFMYLLDTDGGTCHELVGPATDTGPEYALLGAHSPAWSPSGDGLAFIRLGDAWELEFFQLPEQGKRNASWYCRRVGAVASLGSGQHASNASGGAREVCYSPSGRGIIVNYGRLGGTGWGETKVIPLRDDEGKKYENPLGPWVQKIMGKLGGDFRGPAISADGKRVAYSWAKLWVYEWPSTKPRLIVEGGDSPSWIEVSE